MQVKKAVVEAKDLGYTRDGKSIVERFNFRIERGQFVGIIGPNGGGKSTLVKIIVGLLEPTSGSIRVFGEDPRTTAVRRRLSYVPQRGGLIDPQFPATVEEVVRAGLIGRMSGHRALFGRGGGSIDKAMTDMGVIDLRGRIFGQLSGGERQRVLIAKALVSDPELLILDEPTDGLDPETREDLYVLLRKLRKDRGVSMIFVSHDVHAVAREADAAICLRHEMVCHGTDACYLNQDQLRNVFHTKHDEIVTHHDA